LDNEYADNLRSKIADIIQDTGEDEVERSLAENAADRILTMLWGEAMAGLLVLPHSHEPK
jgi:hypothetical protein